MMFCEIFRQRLHMFCWRTGIELASIIITAVEKMTFSWRLVMLLILLMCAVNGGELVMCAHSVTVCDIACCFVFF